MRRYNLPVLTGPDLPQPGAAPASLGMLSIHLEGGRCRVNCPFCYLGQRADAAPEQRLDLSRLRVALLALPYRELALALSEPLAPSLAALLELGRIARERRCLLSVTTTLELASTLPGEALADVGRVSLSVDPWKGAEGGRGAVRAAYVARVAQAVRLKMTSRAEIVLIVTLSHAAFAARLLDGLLAELVALPEVDRVALSALKPPPPWCDRAFWLRALSRLGPLLREQLDRRLFLDCYVAARILGLGACPARPDLSPSAQPGAVAFRSCVYQAAPDFVAPDGDGAELVQRLQGFSAPAACPFPVV